jgi:hypothetical protein
VSPPGSRSVSLINSIVPSICKKCIDSTLVHRGFLSAQVAVTDSPNNILQMRVICSCKAGPRYSIITTGHSWCHGNFCNRNISSAAPPGIVSFLSLDSLLLILETCSILANCRLVVDCVLNSSVDKSAPTLSWCMTWNSRHDWTLLIYLISPPHERWTYDTYASLASTLR